MLDYLTKGKRGLRKDKKCMFSDHHCRQNADPLPSLCTTPSHPRCMSVQNGDVEAGFDNYLPVIIMAMSITLTFLIAISVNLVILAITPGTPAGFVGIVIILVLYITRRV